MRDNNDDEAADPCPAGRPPRGGVSGGLPQPLQRPAAGHPPRRGCYCDRRGPTEDGRDPQPRPAHSRQLPRPGQSVQGASARGHRSHQAHARASGWYVSMHIYLSI